VILLGPVAVVLRDVPTAALAGVLMYVALRLFNYQELRRIYEFSRFEFALAGVTALVVAFVGVEQGIGVALGLAILDRVRTSARPHAYVMGRIRGSTSWEPLGDGDEDVVPGVFVFLFSGPIFYANADVFRAQLTRRLQVYPDTRHVVFDLVAVSDLDFTGSRMFRRLLDELAHQGIDVAVARAHPGLRRDLIDAGMLEQLGSDRIFDSVDEAVVAVTASS
jgi:SulP family sulfate permease